MRKKKYSNQLTTRIIAGLLQQNFNKKKNTSINRSIISRSYLRDIPEGVRVRYYNIEISGLKDPTASVRVK